MRLLQLMALGLLSIPLQLSAQTPVGKDTVRPDTTLVVPIRRMPVDTVQQNKMPVVNPDKPDTLSPEMKEMRRKQDQ